MCACASHRTIELESISTEQRLHASDAVFVHISPSEYSRVDQHKDALFTQPVETGSIWHRAFIGSDDAPLFVINSAIIKTNYEGAGFVARFTYVIDGELVVSDVRYPVHAEGSRAAGLMMGQAMKQAVELGIKEAADQCKLLTSHIPQQERRSQ